MTVSYPDIKGLNALDLEEASVFRDMERNSCVPSSIDPGFSHCLPTRACGSWQFCSTFLELASSACIPYVPSSGPFEVSQQEGRWLGDGRRGQKPRTSVLCLQWIAFQPLFCSDISNISYIYSCSSTNYLPLVLWDTYPARRILPSWPNYFNINI